MFAECSFAMLFLPVSCTGVSFLMSFSPMKPIYRRPILMKLFQLLQEEAKKPLASDRIAVFIQHGFRIQNVDRFQTESLGKIWRRKNLSAPYFLKALKNQYEFDISSDALSATHQSGLFDETRTVADLKRIPRVQHKAICSVQESLVDASYDDDKDHEVVKVKTEKKPKTEKKRRAETGTESKTREEVVKLKAQVEQLEEQMESLKNSSQSNSKALKDFMKWTQHTLVAQHRNIVSMNNAAAIPVPLHSS